MAFEDREKTSFITEWGTYCYRVSFGLKNVGVAYQRAAIALSHHMMHRDAEVYVDDMIVKSRDRADHWVALEPFFQRIRHFRLRMNLKKSTFLHINKTHNIKASNSVFLGFESKKTKSKP